MTPIDGGAAPAMIAHRGYAGVAPENTPAAFRAVADGRHPADAVELDVVPCADGTPVVFHDARLDAKEGSRGITDGSGVVWETSREDVLAAAVLGTDETVPTLSAALDALPPEIAVNVELKNPGSFDVRPGEALDESAVADRRNRWDPFVERVLAALRESSGDVLLSSFHESAIASVRALAPDLPTAAIVSTSIDDGLAVAERYECEAIHPPVSHVLDSGAERDSDRSADDLLTAAADLGCDVNVWTVETWHQAERLAAAGVDGLIADYPGLLRWRGVP